MTFIMFDSFSLSSLQVVMRLLGAEPDVSLQ